MGIEFNSGTAPSFGGRVILEIPTETYSGKKTDIATDAINPYTGVGPGGVGVGETEAGIISARAGIIRISRQALIDSHVTKTYVNGTLGNDTTGDGSEGTPYLTIQRALNTEDSSSVQRAIVLSAGPHFNNTGPGNASYNNYLDDDGKAISFIGVPGQTIVVVPPPTGAAKCHTYGCTNPNTACYGITFDTIVGETRFFAIDLAIIGRQSGEAVHGSIYNCAFVNGTGGDPSTKWLNSLYYEIGSQSTFKLYNCSLSALNWLVPNHNIPFGPEVHNVAAFGQNSGKFVASLATSDLIIDNAVDITSYSPDAEWHITAGGSDTTEGVWSGVYAWT